MINIGDFVTRKSYNNDIIFRVLDIRENTYILQGVEYRLIADANKDDLEKCKKKEINVREHLNKLNINLNRDEYFYLPGKILHIDGDNNYLKKCMDFYKEVGVFAVGKNIKESNVSSEILKCLKETNPDIVVITGHDAFYKKRIGSTSLYKNSENFINAVKEARKYEKSNEKLIIIAGACQSDYENLIKAGATYASSPKRINIHALDPAIIASTLSLSEKGKEVDLLDMLSKTKYGKEGIGGLKSNGTMKIGYPRGDA